MPPNGRTRSPVAVTRVGVEVAAGRQRDSAGVKPAMRSVTTSAAPLRTRGRTRRPDRSTAADPTGCTAGRNARHRVARRQLPRHDRPDEPPRPLRHTAREQPQHRCIAMFLRRESVAGAIAEQVAQPQRGDILRRQRQDVARSALQHRHSSSLSRERRNQGDGGRAAADDHDLAGFEIERGPGQSCGCTISPAKFSRPGSSGVKPPSYR